jgi:hypothetical protein
MSRARHRYAGPFSSVEAAKEALAGMFAWGEVSPGDGPRIDRQGRHFIITVTA